MARIASCISTEHIGARVNTATLAPQSGGVVAPQVDTLVHLQHGTIVNSEAVLCASCVDQGTGIDLSNGLCFGAFHGFLAKDK